MILTPGTLPSCDNTYMTQPNRLEDPVLKAVSSPMSIPLLPNYFDALSKEEEDAPLEETAPREIESTGTQRVTTLN